MPPNLACAGALRTRSLHFALNVTAVTVWPLCAPIPDTSTADSDLESIGDDHKDSSVRRDAGQRLAARPLRLPASSDLLCVT